MKQSKNELKHGPLAKFYYGSLAVLLIALVVSSLIISNIFVTKESKRAEIMTQNISQTLDNEYRYIAEEFFTTSYESIFIRVKNSLEKFGFDTFKVFLFNTSGECVYSVNQESKDIDCGEHLHKHASKNTKIESSIKNDTLTLNTPLFISTEHIGHLKIRIKDNHNFFIIDTYSFILSNYIPLFFVVLSFWLAWIFYSKKYILNPYLNKTFKDQSEQISSSVFSQIVHDTKGDIESIMDIGNDLKDSDNGKKLLILVKNLKESLDQFDENQLQSSKNLESVLFNEFITENKNRVISRYGKQSGIEISYSLKDIKTKKLIVNIHQNRLHRSILNLIQNSIEAVPDKEKAHIHINFEYSSDKLIIKVSDNGRGIPEKINPFSRDYTTKTYKGGSGLYFTRKVILDMNGEISYISGLKGTTFSLILPAIQQKIIMLEDNAEKVERYKRTLSDYGIPHEVFTCPDKLILFSNNYNKLDFFVLDNDLESSLTGLDVAENLSEQGFKNLYIRSGNIDIKKGEYIYIKDFLERSSITTLIKMYLESKT